MDEPSVAGKKTHDAANLVSKNLVHLLFYEHFSELFGVDVVGS